MQVIDTASESESEVYLRISFSVVNLCVGIVSIQILSIIHEEVKQEAIETVTYSKTCVTVENKAAASVINGIIIMSIVITPTLALILYLLGSDVWVGRCTSVCVCHARNRDLKRFSSCGKCHAHG